MLPRFHHDIKPISNCFVTENIIVPTENFESGVSFHEEAGAHHCWRSRGRRPPVGMSAVGQGLGQVNAPHAILSIEIGERASNLQHAMKAAG